MKEVLYLFCFTKTNDLPTIEGQLTRWCSPLFIHSFLGINAILSKVSAEEYSSQSMENKMHDFAWLTPRLFFHEEVIEKVMLYSSVFPVRFGTLFSSLASIEAQIVKHQTFISSFLAKVNQHEEWSIRGFLDQAKAVEQIFSIALQEKEASLSGLAPGVRYLKEQRIRNDTKNKLGVYLRDIYENVINKVCLNAADFKERDTSYYLSETHGQAVIHWAFLIPRQIVSEVHACIEQVNHDYAALGLHFNLTGPWPPYSFCHAMTDANLGGNAHSLENAHP